MNRPRWVGWSLLLVVAPATDCRVSTGPDGICAAIRLDPGRADLDVGTTLRIRVNGQNCAGPAGGHRSRWSSSNPNVATVDSAGLVHARDAGVAQIRFDAGGEHDRSGAMNVTVRAQPIPGNVGPHASHP